MIETDRPYALIPAGQHFGKKVYPSAGPAGEPWRSAYIDVGDPPAQHRLSAVTPATIDTALGQGRGMNTPIAFCDLGTSIIVHPAPATDTVVVMG